MASSNFTTNLHLSAWAAGDRPKRADFVSDNNIIDTQLGGHILDSAIHLSAAQQDKLNTPYTVSIYAGDGSAERTIQLGFTPQLAIVFKRGVIPAGWFDNKNTANFGIATNGYGFSTGVSVTTSGIIVRQIAENADGIRVSLNENGAQYTVIAFK